MQSWLTSSVKMFKKLDFLQSECSLPAKEYADTSVYLKKDKYNHMLLTGDKRENCGLLSILPDVVLKLMSNWIRFHTL